MTTIFGFCLSFSVILMVSVQHVSSCWALPFTLSHFLSLSPIALAPSPAPRLGCGKAILSASVCCSLVGIDIEKIDECFDMESVRQTLLSLWHFSPTPKSEAGGVKQTCIGMEMQELVIHHRRSANHLTNIKRVVWTTGFCVSCVSISVCGACVCSCVRSVFVTHQSLDFHACCAYRS